jgi:hypothetical protein
MEYLKLSWSVSRGRDTYGYNIARLDSSAKRYRCSGGGYDMVGTVLGQYLEAEHQERLQLLKEGGPDGKPCLVDCGYTVPGYMKREDIYGLTFDPKGRARVDGACGRETVKRIAEIVGIRITEDYNRRQNKTNGFFIS